MIDWRVKIKNKHIGKNRLVSPRSKIKIIRPVTSLPVIQQQNNHNQINLLDQPLRSWDEHSLRFWDEHSRWSYFVRGLFWGGVIASTAVCSAGVGAAVTKIELIEQAIAEKISLNTSEVEDEIQPNFAHPVHILLMEVQPGAENIVKFSNVASGTSKEILLLKFEPEIDFAQVINIPTDSRVKIPGFGWGTIADANQYGGTELVLEMVTQLLDGVSIDRYIRATPQVWQQLSASGKLNLKTCDIRIQDCFDKLEQIARQRTVFENIRQRLHIPSYFANFKSTVNAVQPQLDTNLSKSEIISVADFLAELNAESISVDLLSGYTPGKSLVSKNKSHFTQIAKSHSNNKTSIINKESNKNKDISDPLHQSDPFLNRPIAVQNTTDNPELAMQVVAYLKQKNYQKVYFVDQIPLKLDQTKIIIDHSQQRAAERIRNILGFGDLETKTYPIEEKLTIQVGEDARLLPLDNHPPKNRKSKNIYFQ